MTTVRLTNCEACDRLVPQSSTRYPDEGPFCRRCTTSCPRCTPGQPCATCLADCDEAEQAALAEEGIPEPHGEFECEACQWMFAARHAPDDALCDGCRGNDLGEHRHTCHCVRCSEEGGEFDQAYWRRASADGRPGA